MQNMGPSPLQRNKFILRCSKRVCCRTAGQEVGTCIDGMPVYAPKGMTISAVSSECSNSLAIAVRCGWDLRPVHSDLLPGIRSFSRRSGDAHREPPKTVTFSDKWQCFWSTMWHR